MIKCSSVVKQVVSVGCALAGLVCPPRSEARVIPTLVPSESKAIGNTSAECRFVQGTPLQNMVAVSKQSEGTVLNYLQELGVVLDSSGKLRDATVKISPLAVEILVRGRGRFYPEVEVWRVGDTEESVAGRIAQKIPAGLVCEAVSFEGGRCPGSLAYAVLNRDLSLNGLNEPIELLSSYRDIMSIIPAGSTDLGQHEFLAFVNSSTMLKADPEVKLSLSKFLKEFLLVAATFDTDTISQSSAAFTRILFTVSSLLESNPAVFLSGEEGNFFEDLLKIVNDKEGSQLKFYLMEETLRAVAGDVAVFDQGNRGTCSVSSLVYALAVSSPRAYLSVVKEALTSAEQEFIEASDPRAVFKIMSLSRPTGETPLHWIVAGYLMEQVNGEEQYDPVLDRNLENEVPSGYGASMTGVLKFVNQKLGVNKLQAIPIGAVSWSKVTDAGSGSVSIMSLNWTKLSPEDVAQLIREKGGEYQDYVNKDGYSSHALALKKVVGERAYFLNTWGDTASERYPDFVRLERDGTISIELSEVVKRSTGYLITNSTNIGGYETYVLSEKFGVIMTGTNAHFNFLRGVGAFSIICATMALYHRRAAKRIKAQD